jgi:benzoyl-CoA reductase/2-hydroxyglutaryl-CoA dehydratase subunit BcrC/BadD/HgdB
MRRVGYFCTFTPKELIKAAGFTPVRILTGNQHVSLANAHLQNYCCSQVRGSLERLLRGELDIDAAVFTRTCDSLMRLADIWERNSNMLVHNLEFPTKIDGRSREFLIRELYDFKSKLEEWRGKEITSEDLKSSIELYSYLEGLLDEIFRIKPDYELILRAQTEDAEEVLREAEKKVRELRDLKGERGEQKDARVLVTGSVCPAVDVLSLIEEAGFSIVDDLCTGTRFFKSDVESRDVNSMEEAMEFLAEKYLRKAPCPTKSYDGDWRFKYILERVKEVDAVIFLLLKFCEPHFFDYPQLKKELEKMGKKTLLLELEFPIVSYEQLKTRLEAFYEMVV